MPDLVARLANEIASRIRELGFDEPNRRLSVIFLKWPTSELCAAKRDDLSKVV